MEVEKAPAAKKAKKAKKAVKTAPTGEKIPSYQEMVRQAVAETKSRTGSSLVTVKKFVIGKFPVDAAKAPARILKAVNALKAAGALVSAAPAGRKGAHSFKLAKVDKAVTKAGLGASKAAKPKAVKPKTAKPKAAKPKAAKGKAAPKKAAKKTGATKKPVKKATATKKAAAAKKPTKKPGHGVKKAAPAKKPGHGVKKAA